MPYTTQGYMTPADMADMRDLYDLDAGREARGCENPGRCPGCDGCMENDD